MAYKKVLLAVDFAADNDEIVKKALEASEQNKAELLIIHVNEPMAAAYSSMPMGAWDQQIAQIDADLRKHSEEQLRALSTKLNVTSDNQFVRPGRPAYEIKQLAEEQNVDLIVLGTHGQHGIGLLLGSTASGVVHGVGCDVLVVRVNA